MKTIGNLLLILTLLSACNSVKQSSHAKTSETDMASASVTQGSSSSDARLDQSLKLVLDSIDIWIFNSAFNKELSFSAETEVQPEILPGKDMVASGKAVHITVRKAAIENSGTTEIHSTNDSLSVDQQNAHNNESENDSAESDTTSMGKPPDWTWIFIIGALIVAAFAFLKY